MAMAAWLGPAIDSLIAQGGYILSNQALTVKRWRAQHLPADVKKGRYFIYRAG